MVLEETEGLISDDPWAEMRWIIVRFNEQRRKEFKLGWALTVDETMIAWQGKSGPGGIHRKPDPLGCELKNACDSSTDTHPSHFFNLPIVLTSSPYPFIRCDDACGNSGGDDPHGACRIYP